MKTWCCKNKDCMEPFESYNEDPVCPHCKSDDVQEACPQCGSVIDEDTKYCGECKEVVG